ncbi:alginate export family protein [Roseateles albus]|uniref:Alginate export family protein n=1 Tax=Roseateles albus TaxID=2987525 RepID=A0ABT5KGH5_9BURK|nr:alginate export family protein [Roseateles albus]MDC8773022.1 alginate export family protein [Roseateles albus]
MLNIIAASALGAGAFLSQPAHAAASSNFDAEGDFPSVAAGLPAPSPANRTRLPLAAIGEGLRWQPLLYGGIGLYLDDWPYFGHREAFVASSPISRPNGASRRASVAEVSVEPGLGFTVPLGETAWAAFGAGTVAVTATQGADIYRQDSHTEAAIEKAFVGLLHRPVYGPSLLVRAGRTSFTLDDGFLVHLVRTSSNAGERRALNLGARSAADFALTADLRAERWRLQLFALNPDELPVVDTQSRYAGAHFSWQPAGKLDLAVSHLEVTQSDSLLRRPAAEPLPREGLHATTIQARWPGAFGAPGLLLAGLLGQQGHHRADVRALAGYARAGYRWNKWPGRPAVELRHARFSGDRPNTLRFERWDPLLAAGSDEWMGGIAFSKFQSNTNLVQDRLRVFAAPTEGIAVTLDLLRYRAAEVNNLGAGPLGALWPSRDIGHELMAILRWTIGPRFYAQSVASINRPGQGVRQSLAVPEGMDRRSWITLQASLYWFLQ